MKTHEMRLQAEPYAKIARGEKTVEMRLNDEKRRLLRVGDHIRFVPMQGEGALLTRIVALKDFPDFAALYAACDHRTLGYAPDEPCDPSDMARYYAPDEIARYGTLAITVELIKP